MNKTSQIIISAVLAVAVVVLYVLFFTQKPATPAPVAAAPAEGALPIAFVNLDSILVGYTFAVEAQDRLMKQQEDARLELNTKANSLQKEAADFQRKLENNAFLSRERAESEQQRILRKQAELEQREQQLSQEIMQENARLQAELADTILSYIKEFNADGRYQLVLSNNAKDNILYAVDGYDVTAQVVDALNARYKK